ncbi:MAG: hypothetical protein Unbinned1819contig1001_32 [Prokaryotic dsDNA virus sp.]|nr:MAG: hypothetical protein Unbinned1819contig1001_32 [Prokaryotic dsDNA virus sp.]|tara:strand:- start:19441 stop:19935 length:495 start_codon:yes stop_codon:yes gene_type:complete
MKPFALLFALALLAPCARADITHRISSSIQLQVDGAGSVSTRVPSVYAVSGNNVTLGTAGGLGTLTPGAAVGFTPADYSITTAGDAFSLTESYIEGDATPTVLSTTVTSGVVPALPIFGQNTTTSGGVPGSLAGTIATDGALQITAGSSGTSAIGQVIQELTIR